MPPASLHLSPDPPAPHLPAAVLRQYAAGTLPAPERRRVEAHTLDCDLCADALEGYQTTPAATSSAALSDLQQRLHARVAAAPARPRTAWWPAVAAAVLVLCVAMGVWFWPARQELPVATAPVSVSPPATSSQPAPVPAPPVAQAAPEAAEASAAPDPVIAPQPPVSAPLASSRARRKPTGAARPRAKAGQLASAAAVGSSADAGSSASAASPAVAAEVVAEPPRLAARSAADSVSRPESVAAAARVTAANQVSQVLEESAKRKARMPPPPPVAPEPAGGYAAYRGYLRREVQVPSDARTNGVVKLKFTVEADGSITNMQVVKSLQESCDEEAMRLVCEGPAWHPGIVNGQRAAQTVTLDVIFNFPR